MMLKELQNFGLSENEARVYLASLEIGKATADEISKHANVKRPTTYVQIESLMQKGLMSSVEEGKKTYFTPESPEYLRRLFEKNHEELARRGKDLDRMLPELARMFETAGERPRVRFFEGKEGLITMREEFLKGKEKELFVAYSFDALNELLGEQELKKYVERRKMAGIKVRAIYTKKGGALDKEKTEFTESRQISEEQFPFSSDIYMCGNRVALSSLKGKIMGVIIESNEIASSMRSLFLLAWNAAEKEK